MNNDWSSCDFEDKAWVHDRLHAEHPVSPAAQVLQGEYLAEGFNQAFKENNLAHRVHVKFFNDFYYMNIPPLQAHLNDVEHDERIFAANVKEYTKQWAENWLPRIQAHHQAFNHYALNDVCGEFSDFLKRTQDLWTIHGLNFIPMFIAPSVFLRIGKTLCEGDQTHALNAILSLNNESTAMGFALGELAQAYDSEKLQVFLQRYGERSDQYIEITSPTWQENPKPVMDLLKLYAQLSAAELTSKQQSLRQKKSQSYLYLKNKLKTNPIVSVEKFEMLYQAASLAMKVQEDHNYFIEQRIISQSRAFYLKFAALLGEQDLIQNTDDVFYLKPQELLNHFRGENQSLQDLISQRKKSELVAKKLTPPPMLGVPPQGPPAATSLNAAIAEFFGQPFANVDQQNQFQGHGASAGMIEGIARVLNSVDQLSQLQRGEILVVKSTSPAWTPAFAIAGGLITEQGGVLSHAAIVAREYQLPAVVGATQITRHLQTGDFLQVDGTSGIIKVNQK
jgi:phosphohistidine swiveling domain-containing protein